MKDKKRRIRLTFIFLLAASAGAFVLAFSAGSSGLTIDRLFSSASGQEKDAVVYTIFMNIRLPRAIFAFLSGGALSVAGACLQGMFKNPMADSYILGVSSGASFGASIAIVLGFGAASYTGYSLIALFAFFGALAAVFSVYALSRYKGRLSSMSLILSGIAVSALLSALVYFLMILNRDKMENIVMWTLGSFTTVSWDKLFVASPVIILASAACMLFSRDLNIMLQGDEEARHLGVDTQRVRNLLLLLTTLLSSAVVSFCGVIAFVGLMAPHILRLITGPDHKTLLPLSFLGGAVFLLLADTLSRIVLKMQEIPVGVVTATFGAPYFIYLMRRNKKGGSL